MSIVSKKDIKLIKKAFLYLSVYKKSFYICFIAIVVGIIIPLINPIITGGIIENLAELKGYNIIVKYIIILVCLEILQIIFAYLYQINSTKMSNNIIKDFKLDIYKKTLDIPLDEFNRTGSGEFISRIEGDVSQITDILTNDIINFIINLLKVTFIGIMVFKINIIMALITISILPVSVFIFNYYGKMLRVQGTEIKHYNDNYYSFLHQSLNGIRHIKSNGIKKQNLNIYKSTIFQIKDKSIAIGKLSIFSNILSYMLSNISNILILGLGAFFIYKGSLTIQMYIAFISYAGQLDGALQEITSMNSKIQQVLVSLERVFGIINNDIFSSEKFGDDNITNIGNEIEFKDVTFTYDDKVNILEKFNFHTENKGLTIILGKSGVGKSTILNLITKLYSVNSGEIYLNEKNIKNLREEEIRRSIYLVNQEPYLFNMSIRDNFKMVKENCKDEEIIEACKKSFIYDYINNLEDKLDTLITNNGSNLSFGQKQRLSLAMCILKDTPIILLDEITSGLDNESKEYIMETIKELSKEKNIIMVTHDVELVKEEERIFKI